MRREDLKSSVCDQRFWFGPNKNYTSKERIKLPITMKQMNTKDEFMRIEMEVFVIDVEKVPLLCGRETLKEWNGKLDMGNNIITIDM